MQSLIGAIRRVTKFLQGPDNTIDVNLFYSLPSEIRERIISYTTLEWRVVNKHYNELSNKYIHLDKRFNPSKDNNSPLLSACGLGYVNTVRLLLTFDSVDPNVMKGEVLRCVCKNGNAEILRLLLNDKRTIVNKNCCGGINSVDSLEVMQLLLRDSRIKPDAIVSAAIHGRKEIVKLLLEDGREDPGKGQNVACKHGYVGTVKLLLDDSRVNPGDDGNQSLGEASRYGHLEIVKILIKDERVNPADRHNYAAHVAERNKRKEIFELLMSDERVKATWKEDKKWRDRRRKW